MNTKRHKRHKRQSKKVKRKTKTYKKRSIRKYGGNWFDSPHYLYSAMNHGLEKRPMYKFNVVKSMGQGNFASTYLGKIQCDPNRTRVCIKEYGESRNVAVSHDMFSKTLQNMNNNNKNKEKSEYSFPFNKEYLLRIYGKTGDDDDTQDEFRGTELHKRLSQQCSDYVCTLFDYGTILKKNYISRYFGQKYQEKAYNKNTCQEDDCLYALLEKGKMDMRYYVDRLGDIMFVKNLYVIAMKMIRNIYCLHSKHIMHYDIKLQNCVFFPINNKEYVDEKNIGQICNLKGAFDNDVKLIDFGFAEQLEENDILTPMLSKGSPGKMYGSFVRDGKGKLRTQMFHSRFIDIFAILKDINDLHWMKVQKSDIFGKFANVRNSIAVEDDLPPFLDDQRKLLEEKKFSDVPYQNILNKLKEEYSVLNRPR